MGSVWTMGETAAESLGTCTGWRTGKVSTKIIDLPNMEKADFEMYQRQLAQQGVHMHRNYTEYPKVGTMA